MAQSIREPINLVSEPSQVARAEKNTVLELLLQQHRLNSISSIVNRLAYRATVVLNVGSVVLVSRLSLMHLIASLFIAIFQSYHWYQYMQVRRIGIKAIEEELAKRSGEEWEDIYIKTTYFASDQRMKFRPVVSEPIVWAAFVIIFATARFYLQ